MAFNNCIWQGCITKTKKIHDICTYLLIPGRNVLLLLLAFTNKVIPDIRLPKRIL